jgi:hypothetical protein
MSKLLIMDLAYQNDLGGFDNYQLDETLKSPYTMMVHYREPALEVAQAAQATRASLIVLQNDSEVPCGVVAPTHFVNRAMQIYAISDLSFPEVVAHLETHPGGVDKRILERKDLEWCPRHNHLVVPPCTAL